MTEYDPPDLAGEEGDDLSRCIHGNTAAIRTVPAVAHAYTNHAGNVHIVGQVKVGACRIVSPLEDGLVSRRSAHVCDEKWGCASFRHTRQRSTLLHYHSGNGGG